jgi:hypothetical protein
LFYLKKKKKGKKKKNSCVCVSAGRCGGARKRFERLAGARDGWPRHRVFAGVGVDADAQKLALGRAVQLALGRAVALRFN